MVTSMLLPLKSGEMCLCFSLALDPSSKYCWWLKRSFPKIVCYFSPGMMVPQQNQQSWLTDSSQAKSLPWQWDCYSRLLLAVCLATITPDFAWIRWATTVMNCSAAIQQDPSLHLAVVVKDRLSQELWEKNTLDHFLPLLLFQQKF